MSKCRQAGNTLAGLKANGGIDCWSYYAIWDADDTDSILYPPSGEFVSIDIRNSGCGVKKDKSIACWGYAEEPPNNFKVSF